MGWGCLSGSGWRASVGSCYHGPGMLSHFCSALLWHVVPGVLHALGQLLRCCRDLLWRQRHRPGLRGGGTAWKLCEPLGALKHAASIATRVTAKHERGERKGERLATTAEEGLAWFQRYFEYVADSDFPSTKLVVAFV